MADYSTSDNLITNEFINLFMTPRGGYTRETIEMFGLTWPPKKGWKREVIGKPKTAKMIEIEKARNNQQGKVSEIDLQLEQLQKELISKALSNEDFAELNSQTIR